MTPSRSKNEYSRTVYTFGFMAVIIRQNDKLEMSLAYTSALLLMSPGVDYSTFHDGSVYGMIWGL